MNTKLDFLLEIEPQLYSTKPNQYIIFSEKLGLYPKKDAKIIAEFLKYSGIYSFLKNRLEL
jgi:hypothetical protein